MNKKRLEEVITKIDEENETRISLRQAREKIMQDYERELPKEKRTLRYKIRCFLAKFHR